ATVAERGVYLVREVQWCCPTGQINDLALGCQRVDSILEQLAPHPLEKVAVARFLGSILRLEELAHPLDLAFVLAVTGNGFAVCPVWRCAELAVLVHVACSDLDLDAPASGTDHGCMNGAIEVAFRGRDVVVELARNVMPQPVDNAERRITLGNGTDDNTDGP